MGNALFVDISSWQNASQIDWAAYKIWSESGDGVSRILLRSDQGVNNKDTTFDQDWNNAVAAGVDEVFVYHYAYPNLNGAVAEAQSMEAIVGGRLRARDKVMLDLEQNESSAWALAFGQEMARWHPTGSKPVIYDSLSHIQTYLTDPALAGIFDLAVADWTFDPNSRPPAPHPWTGYAWLQYTDRLSVSGMPGVVDSNVLIGGDFIMIKGPFIQVSPGYNGVETSGNAIAAHFGVTWNDICLISDPANNVDNSHLKAYDPNGPYLFRASDGYSEKLWVPGYSALTNPPAPPAPPPDPKAVAAHDALKAWLAE